MMWPSPSRMRLGFFICEVLREVAYRCRHGKARLVAEHVLRAREARCPGHGGERRRAVGRLGDPQARLRENLFNRSGELLGRREAAHREIEHTVLQRSGFKRQNRPGGSILGIDPFERSGRDNAFLTVHHMPDKLEKNVARAAAACAAPGPGDRAVAHSGEVDPEPARIVEPEALDRLLAACVDGERTRKGLLVHRIAAALAAAEVMAEHVGARDHDPLQPEDARRLEDVRRAHDVELDGAQRILLRPDGEHRVRRHVHELAYRVLAEDSCQGQGLQHVALDQRHLREVDDPSERLRLRRAVHENRPLPLLHQDARDLRADQARADDEDRHAPILAVRRERGRPTGIKAVMSFPFLDSGAWRGYRLDRFPHESWAVEGRGLRGLPQPRGISLVSRERFGDFDLSLEWRLPVGGNSGVMCRVTEEDAAPWQSGPEMQLLDDANHPDGRVPETSCGALYGLYAPRAVPTCAPGLYNIARISVHGSRVEHWLNGVRVLACDLASDEFQAR